MFRWHVCRVNLTRKMFLSYEFSYENFPEMLSLHFVWIRKNPARFPPNFPPDFPAKIKKISPTSFCRSAGRSLCYGSVGLCQSALRVIILEGCSFFCDEVCWVDASYQRAGLTPWGRCVIVGVLRLQGGSQWGFLVPSVPLSPGLVPREGRVDHEPCRSALHLPVRLGRGYVTGKKKAHKHKCFCPVGLGTTPGLSRGFHRVCPWDKPRFSPCSTQWKPDFTGFVPGTNPVCPWDKPGLSLGQSRGRRAAQKVYVKKVYVLFSLANVHLQFYVLFVRCVSFWLFRLRGHMLYDHVRPSFKTRPL